MLGRVDLPLWWFDQVPTEAKAATKLLGAQTVGELLTTIPSSYQHTAGLVEPDHSLVGEIITCSGVVAGSQFRATGGGRPMFRAMLNCGATTIELIFFARHGGMRGYYEKSYPAGAEVTVTGKLTSFKGRLGITHPQLAATGGGSTGPALLAHYRGANPQQDEKIRAAMTHVLKAYGVASMDDWLSPDACVDYRVPAIGAALETLHRPGPTDNTDAAVRRLVLEEAIIVQLAMLRRREVSKHGHAKPCPPRSDGLLKRLDDRLPFELTGAQRRVGATLARELADSAPMHRLVQGDVGSGKTLVALRAMLQVVDAGGQCAFLAPTEILAAQHFRSLHQLLGPLVHQGLLGGDAGALTLTLLTGSLPTAKKREALALAAGGEAGIVVGTHALLSENVTFADLRFVVVDEQHKFGVRQRDALKAKAFGAPHTLVMTATPIPRTVALTIYGDHDLSELDELPPGRQTIASHVVTAERPAWLPRMWEVAAEHLSRGERAYIVTPRVEDDKDADIPDDAPQLMPGLGVQKVAQVAARQLHLPAEQIGVVHGKTPSDEKDRVMGAFSRGDISVLVATTVVEVGVDVPEATVMVITDADRFGIATLHQLRGRVGRGAEASICFLVFHDEDKLSVERLRAVAATSDGFALAELDAQWRREGEVLGDAQSGYSATVQRVAAVRDADLVQGARNIAGTLLLTDHTLRDRPGFRRAVVALEDAHGDWRAGL